MIYVVANFHNNQMARICSNSDEASRLQRSLEKEGIPSVLGEAKDLTEADWRLRDALGE